MNSRTYDVYVCMHSRMYDVYVYLLYVWCICIYKKSVIMDLNCICMHVFKCIRMYVFVSKCIHFCVCILSCTCVSE